MVKVCFAARNRVGTKLGCMFLIMVYYDQDLICYKYLEESQNKANTCCGTENMPLTDITLKKEYKINEFKSCEVYLNL